LLVTIGVIERDVRRFLHDPEQADPQRIGAVTASVMVSSVETSSISERVRAVMRISPDRAWIVDLGCRAYSRCSGPQA
jgi:hypothetical protein